jgi:hypothetical protein
LQFFVPIVQIVFCPGGILENVNVPGAIESERFSVLPEPVVVVGVGGWGVWGVLFVI